MLIVAFTFSEDAAIGSPEIPSRSRLAFAWVSDPLHPGSAEVSRFRQAPVPQPQSTSAIYVNRGLGTIGAPIRLGVLPEITLITLRRA